MICSLHQWWTIIERRPRSILLLHIWNAAANGKKKRNNFNIFVNNSKHKKSISTNSEKARLARRKKYLRRLFRSAKEKLLFWFFSCFFVDLFFLGHKNHFMKRPQFTEILDIALVHFWKIFLKAFHLSTMSRWIYLKLRAEEFLFKRAYFLFNSPLRALCALSSKSSSFNKTNLLLIVVFAHLSTRTSKKVVWRLLERIKSIDVLLSSDVVFLLMNNFNHQWFSKMARSVTKDSQTLKVSLMIQEFQFENSEMPSDLNRQRECAIKILLVFCHRRTRVHDCFSLQKRANRS